MSAGRSLPRRRAAAIGSAIAWLSVPPLAAAQPSPPPVATASPVAPTTAAAAEALLAHATELNREGIALLKANDTERALDYFRRSRAVLPTTKNTANAAICLDRLGRYDEALELYEELLVRYLGGLDDEDRKNLGPVMAALLQKVGSLAVTSSAGGALEVDGKPRGRLPLTGPVRVLPGKHDVRVTRSGFVPLERSVDVPVGAVVSVGARLAAIPGVGQLVVEEASAEDAEVFVDRARVGVVPWEGSLAPGKHVLWTRAGDRGSAPTPVTVLEGQTSLVRVESRPLGAPVRVRVEPATASLEIDGAPLGEGVWQGRLPHGAHRVVASEAGYTSQSVEVVSVVGASESEVPLRLRIDPAHPRWPQRERGVAWVGVFGGFAGGGTFVSGAESACPARCDKDPSVSGFVAGLRGGFRFPFGLSLELGGGYMQLGMQLTRRLDGPFGPGGAYTVHYRLDDRLRVDGPFAAGGASYVLALGKHFDALARFGAGVLAARATDPVTGTAATTGPGVPVVLEGRNAAAHAAAPFLSPELGVGLKLGPFDLTASLALIVFVADGPTFADRGRFGAATADGVADPGSVSNAQESGLLANERAYRPFVVWSPQLSIARRF